MSSLILNHEIITTEVKAKIVKRQIDKVITRAKKGDLHSRRLIHSLFNSKNVTQKLVDHLAPQMSARTSGFTKIISLGNRRGDNTPMAKVTFTDSIIAVQEVKTNSDKANLKTKITKTKSAPKK